MVFDFNLLDNIQLSDDENETHPNIDTPSLFRMRHRHRLERQSELAMQKQDLEFKIQKHKNTIDAGGLSDSEFRKLSEELDEFNAHLNEIIDAEKKQGLDIDHFVTDEKESKSVFTKETEEERQIAELTKSSSPQPIPDEHLAKVAQKIVDDKQKESEQEKVELKPASKNVVKNEADIENEIKLLQINKNYAVKHKKAILEMFTLKNHNKLKNFLFEHPELIHQGVLTWALIKMVDYQYEQKLSHVKHMVHPIVHLKFIVELISAVNGDKKKIVSNYFAKFEQQEPNVMKSYNDEVKHLLVQAEKLAEERQKKLIQDDMEERRKHLNGEEPLDPNDVINQLPDEMVQCFVKRDIGLLQEVISKMDPKEAEQYMNLCVRAGLWNPGPNPSPNDNSAGTEERQALENDSGSESSTVYEENPNIDNAPEIAKNEAAAE